MTLHIEMDDDGAKKLEGIRSATECMDYIEVIRRALNLYATVHFEVVMHDRQLCALAPDGMVYRLEVKT